MESNRSGCWLTSSSDSLWSWWMDKRMLRWSLINSIWHANSLDSSVVHWIVELQRLSGSIRRGRDKTRGIVLDVCLFREREREVNLDVYVFLGREIILDVSVCERERIQAEREGGSSFAFWFKQRSIYNLLFYLFRQREMASAFYTNRLLTGLGPKMEKHLNYQLRLELFGSNHTWWSGLGTRSLGSN